MEGKGAAPISGDKHPPTKVLYVLGRGRSGSTIFANVIGEHEGFFSAGELRYFWDPVVQVDGQCACGEAVSNCEVWSKVLERVGDVDVRAAGEWQREVVTERNLLRLLRYRHDGSWLALERYLEVMSRTYEAISAVTGARVIVDSSKRPSYAAAVRSMRLVSLYCVHMTRDPRASAYSWATSRHASVFGEGQEVKQRGAIDSTIRWNVLNIESELLARKMPRERWMQLRYEAFVSAPREVAARVASFAGEPSVLSPFVDHERIVLGPTHTIAGNPSRFSTGELTIRERGEWRNRQRTIDGRLATAVALPLLRRYGYPVRRP